VRILLLIESPRRADVSHAFYVNELRGMGHAVHVGELNTLGWDGDRFTCRSGAVTGDVAPYEPVPFAAGDGAIADVERVWLLNQPHPAVAPDVWQLLWRLDREVPFVNSVTGLLMLNNKNNLPLVVPADHLPRSICGADAEWLLARMDEQPARRWVIKRPNGGCGADVFVLSPGDTNRRALVQSMTGNAAAAAEMTDPGLLGLRQRHVLLQEHVPHTVEKRVVVCGGEVVAVQEKTLAPDDHRGNVAQHAEMQLGEASEEEVALAEAIAARLLHHGIRFAGIDMAYPYVFEVNLVNPGGLVKRLQLGLEDPSFAPALRLLLERSGPPSLVSAR
jgi:glutathione synthase